MARQWILAVFMVLSAGPALAQVNHDAENPDIVLPDPVWVTKPAIQSSRVTAETAMVSPATDSVARVQTSSQKQACRKQDACALVTPESR